MDNVRLNEVIEQSDLTLKPKGSAENAEQIANQLHQPIRHKVSRSKVIVYSLDEIWACDLMDLSNVLYTTNE